MAEQAQLIIEAVDRATKTLQGISSEIKAMGTAAQTQGMVTKRAFDAVQGAVESSKGALKNWFEITGAQAAVSLWKEALGAVKAVATAIKEGEGALRVEAAFARVAQSAGVAGDAMLQALREATKFKVADLELEKLAIRLDDIGIRGENAIKAIAFARQKAAERGEDVEVVQQKILQGLATGSQRALARYGILIDRTLAYEQAAKAAGVSVELLTEEEKRLAVQQVALGQMMGSAAISISGFGSTFVKATVSAENSVEALKKALAGGLPMGLMEGGVFTTLFQQYDTLDGRLRALPATIAEIQSQIAAVAEQGAMDLGGETDPFAFGASDAAERLAATRIEGLQAQMATALANLREEIALTATGASEFADQVEKMGAGQIAASGMADAARSRLQAYRTVLVDAQVALDGLGAAGKLLGLGLGDLDGTLRKIESQLSAVTHAQQVAAWSAADYTRELQNLRNLQADGKARTAVAIALAADIKVYEEVTARVRGLASEVSGLIKIPTGVGIAERLLGPQAESQALGIAVERLDAITEAAKRFDEAMAKGTDAAQVAAFQALRSATEDYKSTVLPLADDQAYAAEVTAQFERQLKLAAVAMNATKGASLSLGQSILDQWGTFSRALQADPQWRALMLFADWGKAGAKALFTPPPKRSSGGGGGKTKPEDITPEELRLRLQLAQATDALVIAELEHEAAVLKIKQGKAGMLGTIAAMAEEERRYTDAVLGAIDAETKRLAEADAERAKSAKAFKDMLGTTYAAAAGKAQELVDQWKERNKELVEFIASGAQSASNAWQSALSAAWGNQGSADQAFMARFDAVASAAQNAATIVGQALGTISGDWASTLAGALPGMTGVLTALGVQAKEAAYVIGGVALVASGVFALLQMWGPAGALALSGASLLAFAAKGTKKPQQTAAAPSASSVATPQAQAGGGLFVTLNFSGQPLETRSDIHNAVYDALEAGRFLGRRMPVEAMP